MVKLIYSEKAPKFCGLLRIYELYIHGPKNQKAFSSWPDFWNFYLFIHFENWWCNLLIGPQPKAFKWEFSVLSLWRKKMRILITLKNHGQQHYILVYDRNHYFGLGLIPKPKPKLADTFNRYRNVTDTETTF